jgi:hypothetical protein
MTFYASTEFLEERLPKEGRWQSYETKARTLFVGKECAEIGAYVSTRVLQGYSISAAGLPLLTHHSPWEARRFFVRAAKRGAIHLGALRGIKIR